MTPPLLFPDEAARLVPGERLVIVRPGDEPWGTCDWGYCQTVSAKWRRSDHPDARGWLPVCDKHADKSSAEFVAPQAWVALTGPCPNACESGWWWCDVDEGEHIRQRCPSPDCRDGRRIEPLHTECDVIGTRCRIHRGPVIERGGLCSRQGRLVGRGSIEVVPVVAERDIFTATGRYMLLLDERTLWLPHLDQRGHRIQAHVDPLPRPGVDFGIVIDCVEVAS